MWGQLLLEALGENLESILAVAAIFLTIQQSYYTRKHNKLSVLPSLSTTTKANRVNGTMRVEFELFNGGLGPAYIKSFQYLIDGKPLHAHTPALVYQAVQDNTELAIVDWYFGIYNPGYVIAKDKSETLAVITFGDGVEVTYEEMKRFNVEVCYESAYGEEFCYDSRTHLTSA